MTPFTYIVPSLPFTFHEGIPGSKDCLYTQWPARTIDHAETLDVWQEQSGLWSATPLNTLLPSLLLCNCSFKVAICHQDILDMLLFLWQGRILFANPFSSVMEDSLLYQTSLSGGGLSSSRGSGLCGWASCKHW